MKFKGLYTALVTPFTASGELDEEGLRENVRFQIKSGVDGVVPLGTTGEAPTLTQQEKERIMRIVVDEAKGRVTIMAGTGSYSTQLTIEATKKAHDLGADAALIVSPYYNKPTQEGLYKHYHAIANACQLSIIVYNIQGRTGQNIQTDTLKRIAEHPKIVGVKEASGNLTQIGEVIEVIAHHRSDFSVFSGDDGNTFAVMALGGHGVISVVSNLYPKEVKSLVTSLQKGDYVSARKHHFALMPIIRAAFIETNPIPIKAAMQVHGMASGSCRLPLCDLSKENKEKLHAVLKGLKHG